MRTFLVIAAAATTLSGLSACSEKAADKIEEAGNSVGQDLERGINTVDDSAQSTLRNTGHAIGKVGDDISDATSHAASKAGEQVDKAKQDAGAALEKAGNDLKN